MIVALAAVAVMGTGALVGLAALSSNAGRTPGEVVAYAKVRLQGHPRLEWLATPALNGLRDWFGEPDEVDLAVPFAVPPLAPNPAAASASVQAGQRMGPPRQEASDPNIIRVGPQRAITRVGLAAQLAKDGNVIEIDPGDYYADVAVWDRAAITIRGMGPRVRLIAAGADAEGKAIWVVRRGRVIVENIDFIGARVPDRNGAGIRHEGGHLTVRRCLFFNNENGILTGGDASARLDVENSEFGYNGAGDGLSHNLYVGGIGSLNVSGSYFHHANQGHLIKSRAQVNRVEYNRLSDESGGRASYELEFPNGGMAYVIGNLIQQGRLTRNSVMISYGVEGYVGPQNQLFLVHNTVVNDHPLGATFLRVTPGASGVLTRNNLFVGPGKVFVGKAKDSAGDSQVDWRHFVQPARDDYRLSASARARFEGAAGVATPAALTPQSEYVHPAQLKNLARAPRYPGALQTPGP